MVSWHFNLQNKLKYVWVHQAGYGYRTGPEHQKGKEVQVQRNGSGLLDISLI